MMVARRLRKRHTAKPRTYLWKNKVLWGVALGVIAVVSFSYSLLFAPFFQVGEFDTEGNLNITRADLHDFIWPKLQKSFFLFSSRSIFFVSEDKIERALLERFPRIAEASAEKRFPDALVVKIRERDAAAVWCVPVAVDEKEECFFIDREGVVFEDSVDAEGRFVLRNYAMSESVPSLGQTVISKEILSGILDMAGKMRDELRVEVSEVLLASQERINMRTEEGWEVFLTLPFDASWQLTRLKLVLEEEIPAEKRRGLEYIDLRFSKVYYRYLE